jgi:SNF2 family DNA or RNA helicase
VRGRVLSVHSLVMGGFVVVLGPPPDMFTFSVSDRPPKVGDKVTVRGRLVGTERVEAGGVVGTLGTIEPTRWEVDPDDYPRRVVSPEWYERVQAAVQLPLYRYQVDGAAWLASRLAAHRGSLLCDDMGLGKTVQTVAAICCTRSFPAIIVCPGSLKIQWAREFEYAARQPLVGVIEGRSGPIQPAQVHILNYELIRYREQQIAGMKPRVVIFDEAQALKTAKVKIEHRAAVGTRLAQLDGVCAIALTGTPIQNRPAEWWRLLHLVDKNAWSSYTAFARLYCGKRPRGEQDLSPTPLGRVVATSAGRVQRIDELHAKAGPYMLRRLKHQVLSDLPPKSRRSLLVAIDARDLVHYRAAEKDVVGWLRRLRRRPRSSSSRTCAAALRSRSLRRRYRITCGRGSTEPTSSRSSSLATTGTS